MTDSNVIIGLIPKCSLPVQLRPPYLTTQEIHVLGLD